MGIKLPKKSFHSISDLCKEWGIDYSAFKHYIEDRKILRLALKTDEFHRSTYECVRITNELKKHIDFLVDSRTIITAVISDIERLLIKKPEPETEADNSIIRADISITAGGITYSKKEERKEKRLRLDELLENFELTTDKKHILEGSDFFELPGWIYINDRHMVQKEDIPQVPEPRAECLLVFEDFHGEKIGGPQ